MDCKVCFFYWAVCFLTKDFCTLCLCPQGWGQSWHIGHIEAVYLVRSSLQTPFPNFQNWSQEKCGEELKSSKKEWIRLLENKEEEEKERKGNRWPCQDGRKRKFSRRQLLLQQERPSVLKRPIYFPVQGKTKATQMFWIWADSFLPPPSCLN